MARDTLRRLDSHIGKRLKELRKSRGLSQEAVGELLEVSLQQISRFENGQQRLSASQLYQLARGLDVPVSWFYEGYKESKAENSRLKTILKRDPESWQPATDPELEKSLLVAFRGIADEQDRRLVIQSAQSYARKR